MKKEKNKNHREASSNYIFVRSLLNKSFFGGMEELLCI